MTRRRETSIFGLALIASVLLGGASASVLAAPRLGGLESRGPHCRVTHDVPEWRSVWLGHFSGGRYVRTGARRLELDWQNKYSCFASRASCDRWQRSMGATYRSVEGYRACLLLRNGHLG
jgi:hypothetical protein